LDLPFFYSEKYAFFLCLYVQGQEHSFVGVCEVK
jgi:hypothetical protein